MRAHPVGGGNESEELTQIRLPCTTAVRIILVHICRHTHTDTHSSLTHTYTQQKQLYKHIPTYADVTGVAFVAVVVTAVTISHIYLIHLITYISVWASQFSNLAINHTARNITRSCTGRNRTSTKTQKTNAPLYRRHRETTPRKHNARIT